jgi:hypothetical protein
MYTCWTLRTLAQGQSDSDLRLSNRTGSTPEVLAVNLERVHWYFPNVYNENCPFLAPHVDLDVSEGTGAVLGAGDPQAEDLPSAVGVPPTARSACRFTIRPAARTFSTGAAAEDELYHSAFVPDRPDTSMARHDPDLAQRNICDLIPEQVGVVEPALSGGDGDYEGGVSHVSRALPTDTQGAKIADRRRDVLVPEPTFEAADQLDVWRRVLVDRHGKGHLVTLQAPRPPNIEDRLLVIAAADHMISRRYMPTNGANGVRTSNSRKDSLRSAGVDVGPYLGYADALEKSYGLSRKGIASRLHTLGDPLLADAVITTFHVQLAHAVDCEYWGLNPDQRHDLTSWLFEDKVMSSGKYLSNYDPSLGTLQRFLRVQVRPNAVGNRRLRSLGLQHLARPPVHVDSLELGYDGQDQPYLDAECATIDDRAELNWILNGIPVDPAILLRDGHDLDDKSIADRLGQTSAAVRQRRHRAWKKLRQAIGPRVALIDRDGSGPGLMRTTPSPSAPAQEDSRTSGALKPQRRGADTKVKKGTRAPTATDRSVEK